MRVGWMTDSSRDHERGRLIVLYSLAYGPAGELLDYCFRLLQSTVLISSSSLYSFDQGALKVEGVAVLPDRIKEMKYDGGQLYLDCLRGGTRVPWIVDVAVSGAPFIVGTHEVVDWVIGLEHADGRVYELVDGTIRLATVM